MRHAARRCQLLLGHPRGFAQGAQPLPGPLPVLAPGRHHPVNMGRNQRRRNVVGSDQAPDAETHRGKGAALDPPVERVARDRSLPGGLGDCQQAVSTHALVPLGYGVGVLAVAERMASVATNAVAAPSPSLRTSPAMAGGKRAESPSRKVNSVSAAIASGSVGTGVPGSTRRETVIGTSTRKVNAPAAV